MSKAEITSYRSQIDRVVLISNSLSFTLILKFLFHSIIYIITSVNCFKVSCTNPHERLNLDTPLSFAILF